MPLGAFKAALMGTAGVSKGDVVLLSTQTASDSATLSFTSGINATYGEYIFRFYNLNPATDGQKFLFNGSIDGGSNYNVTKTTSNHTAYQGEDGSDATLKYYAGDDLQQETAFLPLTATIGNGGDESSAGELHLFNPSGTTYVKHFYSRFQDYNSGDYTIEVYTGGYFNNADNIDAVQFKMESGNFDGKIKMWGVK